MQIAQGCLELHTGRGEDAEPIVEDLGAGWHLLAVLDGLGGAGARSYTRTNDGAKASGARIGAGTARDALMAAAPHLPTLWKEVAKPDGGAASVAGFLARELTEHLRGALVAERSGLDASQSVLRVSGALELPTTVAMLLARRDARDVDACAVWAGDSHAYAFSRSKGLQLLTRAEFDVQNPGVYLAKAFDDKGVQRERRMPNDKVAHAGDGWSLSGLQYNLDDCLFLLVATDGVYGCQSGPMAFERAMLATLAESASAQDFEGRFLAGIEKQRTDDASFAVLFLADWSEIREVAQSRVAALDGLVASGGRDEAQIWRAYSEGLLATALAHAQPPAAVTNSRNTLPGRRQPPDTTVRRVDSPPPKKRRSVVRYIAAAIALLVVPYAAANVFFGRGYTMDQAEAEFANRASRECVQLSHRQQQRCVSALLDEVCGQVRRREAGRCQRYLPNTRNNRRQTELQRAIGEFDQRSQDVCRRRPDLGNCLIQLTASICNRINGPEHYQCRSALQQRLHAQIGVRTRVGADSRQESSLGNHVPAKLVPFDNY